MTMTQITDDATKEVKEKETNVTSELQVQPASVQTEEAVTKIDSTQKVETNAYVPTYKVKPEFKQALLKAIGDLPFNQIAGLINAIDVPVIDHQTLTQIVNAIGQFPYTRVEPIMKNVGNFVTQVIED